MSEIPRTGPATPLPSPVRVAISGAFFLTGASALAYELVWARSLERLLGTTTHAATAVLAAFMGGLALGSVIFGRLADRWGRRGGGLLALYGGLEIAVGLYGLAFPWLQSAMTGLYVGIARPLEPGSPGTFAVRFALSLLLVLVPTTFMGGTLPVLVRFLTLRAAEVGRRVAWLYFLNSAGAAVGCLIAGFLTVGRYGMRFTAAMAVLVNALVGLAAILAARRTPGAIADEPAEGGPAPGLAPRRVLLAAFLSGMAALAYEIGWFRLLAMVLGSSADAFTLMLATFIGGLALGSLWAGRRVDRWRDPAAVLVRVQAAIAATAILALPMSMQMPNLSLRLRAMALGSYPLFQGMQLLLCALLMAVPTFLLGISFPLLARLAAADRGARQLGARVGGVLASATAGNIAGTLLAGLGAIPLLGVRFTILLAATTSLAAAAAARSRGGSTLPLAGAAVLVGLVGGVAPGWDLARLTGAPFRVRELNAEALRQFDRINRDRAVLFAREDAGATVTVEAYGENKVLRINGKPDASLMRKDMATQRLLAHYALLFRPQARDVMVVGLGSGVTAGAVLRHPQVESVTVAEISRGVWEAAPWFAEVNHRCWEDPRLRIRIEDARNVLLVDERDYDVIISEPSNLWMSGVAALFTQEFYDIVRERLRPGGLFVQWIQAYEITDEDLQLVLRTVLSVFPRATVFRSAPGDLEILASVDPVDWDLEAAAERLTVEGVRQDLAEVGVHSLYTLLANQMIPADDLPAFAGWNGSSPGQAFVHVDDWPILERSTPRAFFEGSRARLPEERYRSESPHMLLARWLAGRTPTAGERYDQALYVAGVGGDSDEVVAALRAALRDEPSHRPSMRLLAATLSMRGEWPEATSWMARAATTGEPVAEDFCHLSRYRLELARAAVGVALPFDPGPSLAAMERCRSLAPDDPVFLRQHIALLEEAGRAEEARALRATLPARR